MNGEDNFITKVVPFKELRMYTESQLPYILETNLNHLQILQLFEGLRKSLLQDDSFFKKSLYAYRRIP